MTVKELIVELWGLPLDAIVVVRDERDFGLDRATGAQLIAVHPKEKATWECSGYVSTDNGSDGEPAVLID